MKPEHGFLLGILIIVLIVTGLGLSSLYATQWQQYNILYYLASLIIGGTLYLAIQKHEQKQKK